MPLLLRSGKAKQSGLSKGAFCSVLDYQIAKIAKNTVTTGITGSEIFVQYRPILADTYTTNSHYETNKIVYEMEISAKHIFAGIYST